MTSRPSRPARAALVVALLMLAAACSTGRPDADAAAETARPEATALEGPAPPETSSDAAGPMATEPDGVAPAPATEVGGDPPGTTAVPVPTTWPPGTDPSPGCFSDHERADTTTTFDLDGVARTYRYRPASGTDPDGATPVIVLLHGLGSDSASVLDYSAMASAADGLGAGLVLPEAIGNDRRWTLADVPFFATVLDQVEADRCIDRNRVWLAGLSMGGFMSARLACDLGGRFAAVGAVAGFGYDTSSCPNAPPTPVLTFHGTADSVIPFVGRPPSFQQVIPSQGAETDIAAWAVHNGCAAPPVVQALSSEVTVQRWVGCSADTTLYTIVGGGHSWPGAYPYPQQGYTTAQVSATAVLANFFAGHRLSDAAG